MVYYTESGFNLLDKGKFGLFVENQKKIKELNDSCQEMLLHLKNAENQGVDSIKKSIFYSSYSLNIETLLKWANRTLSKFSDYSNLSLVPKNLFESFIEYVFYWSCLESPSNLFFLHPFLHLEEDKISNLIEKSSSLKELISGSATSNYYAVELNPNFPALEEHEIVYIPKDLCIEIYNGLKSFSFQQSERLETFTSYLMKAATDPNKVLIAKYIW